MLSLANVPPAIVRDPVPNAELFPMFSVPDVNDTPPLNVFAPPNTNAPVPVFFKAPEPVITPLIVKAVATSSFDTTVDPETATPTLVPNVNAPVPDPF